MPRERSSEPALSEQPLPFQLLTVATRDAADSPQRPELVNGQPAGNNRVIDDQDGHLDTREQRQQRSTPTAHGGGKRADE